MTRKKKKHSPQLADQVKDRWKELDKMKEDSMKEMELKLAKMELPDACRFLKQMYEDRSKTLKFQIKEIDEVKKMKNLMIMLKVNTDRNTEITNKILEKGEIQILLMKKINEGSEDDKRNILLGKTISDSDQYKELLQTGKDFHKDLLRMMDTLDKSMHDQLKGNIKRKRKIVEENDIQMERKLKLKDLELKMTEYECKLKRNEDKITENDFKITENEFKMNKNELKIKENVLNMRLLEKQVELKEEEIEQSKLEYLDKIMNYSNEQTELQEMYEVQNMMSEKIPRKDCVKVSVVKSNLMKANICKVTVKCKAVHKVEIEEMKIPKLIKIDENFSQKATCTN